MTRQDKDKTLLIIHPGTLGDVVISFGIVNALKKRFKRIEMVCRNEIGELATHIDLADAFYDTETSWFSSIFSYPLTAQAKRVIDGCDTALIFSVSYLLSDSFKKNKKKGVFRIQSRPEPQRRIHVCRYQKEQIVDAGILEKKELDASFNEILGFTPDSFPDVSKRIFLSPGSGSMRKNISFDAFFQCHRLLSSMGFIPEYILGPAESDFLAKKNKGIFRGATIHTPQNLTALYDLLKSGAGYIGNDSGVTHLAAFAGLPVAALFGPSDPVRWKPVGANVSIHRVKTDCLPCFETTDKNCDAPVCQTEVRVFEIVDSLIERITLQSGFHFPA